VAGNHNPATLAADRDIRCTASVDTLTEALTGTYRPEHVFALRQALELYDCYPAKGVACDHAIAAGLASLEQADRETALPAARYRTRQEHEPAFDVRAALFQRAANSNVPRKAVGTASGLRREANVSGSGTKVTSALTATAVVLITIDTVLTPPSFAVARSRWPSPLKSPTATDSGFPPTRKSRLARKDTSACAHTHSPPAGPSAPVCRPRIAAICLWGTPCLAPGPLRREPPFSPACSPPLCRPCACACSLLLNIGGVDAALPVLFPLLPTL
jgi:hypothetical protein